MWHAPGPGSRSSEGRALRDASEEDAAPDGVIGRERELEAIDRFLAERPSPRALVLEGGPGIGKSTLWAAACARARSRGITVLATRASQAEVTLAFGGLVDLFGHVPDSVLGHLPDAQRRALAIALRRTAPDRRRPDTLAVSAGARAALDHLAAAGPVLVAVDDEQWQDGSTASVLAYVGRRLTSERIAFLLARRTASDGPVDGPAIADTLPRTTLELEPLSLSSLHHVIRARTGGVLPRPLLRRVADVSAGNPLYALELASVLTGSPTPRPGDPLPAPPTLLDAVARRVRQLPPRARETLVVVASLASPSPSTIAAITGSDPGPALHAARQAGILDELAGSVTFAHPLYAQCVVRLASDGTRRAVHRRIAQCTDEPEERARHLALAGDPPDAATAAVLDDGAAAARRRGALQAASELLMLAQRFTPPDDPAAAHRRGFSAAELAILVGDRDAAREVLAHLVDEAASPLRERAAGLYAEILANQGDAEAAERLLRSARDRPLPPEVAARLDLDLAYVTLVRLAPAESAGCTDRAVAAARRGRDAHLLAEALAYDALARLLSGQDVDETLVAEALDLEDRGRAPYMGLPPRGVIGLVRTFAGRHDDARELLAESGAALDAIGDDCDLAHVLLWSAFLELRAGRLDVAHGHARQAATIAETTGSQLLRAWACAAEALVAAQRGDPIATERAIAEALRDGPGHGIVGVWVLAARGLAGLASGDVTGALAAYAPLLEHAGAAIAEPIPAFFLPDVAEALARAGHPDDAERLIAGFEAAARARGRAWALAASARARGIALAERGRHGEAIVALRAADAHHAAADMPVERARTRLHLGLVERRTGERRAARASLDDAAAAFREAGADGWESLAREELRRIPGRRAGDGRLTASELQVAQLSGAGRTNREVAAALFVTPKTVEANLTRIYRKLDISTRAELGAWVARHAGGNDQG